MTEVFKQSYGKLLIKQNKIENEIKNFIKYKKYPHLLAEFSDLKKEYELTVNGSAKSRTQVFGQVSALRQLLRTFKDKKSRFMKGENVRNELKNLTTTFNGKLKEFKNVQNEHYASLCKEAERLENEIYVQEELLHQETVEASCRAQQQPKSCEDAADNGNAISDDFANVFHEAVNTKQWEDKDRLKSIITRLESRYVENGGYNCGWHKAEQDDFLKLLMKHGNNPDSQRFFSELLKCFPLYSSQELTAHIKVYSENKQIAEIKRKLIKIYKELSKKAAEAEVTDVIVEEEKPKKEVKLPDEEERLQMKQKVDNWKKEKELEKFIKAQKEKDKLEEQARKEKEKQATNAETLKRIKEEKMRRAKEKETLKQKEEELKKLKRTEFSPETLNRIKQKEEDAIRRRSEALKRKKQEDLRKEEILNQVNNKFKSKYAYVENKFDQYTEAVLKKQNEKFDPKKHQAKHGDNFAGNLIRTTGRKLVSWRSGV